LPEQINPVARAVVDAKFRNFAFDRFDIPKVAKRDPADPGVDGPCSDHVTKPGTPRSESLALKYLKHRRL
jgi:hypothetical protein